MPDLKSLENSVELFECIRMAELSRWIYGKRAKGFPGVPPPLEEPFKTIAFLGTRSISTQGAAIVTERKIYLVFRGSESVLTWGGLKDWARNLNFLLRGEFCGIRAHRGFVKATMPVLKTIREILSMYRDQETIEVGGHSLGGAIATLVAVAIESEFRRERTPRRVRLITLGQPRVSRWRLLDLALQNVPYTRVQNGSDVVPRKPTLGYSHGGRCMYLSNGGELLWDPSPARMLADRALTLLQRGTDHAGGSYLQELLRHAKQH